MNGSFSLPSDVEFSLLRFHLEFQERFHLGLAELLRLRRELFSAARLTLGDRRGLSFQTLFDPPLPDDPVALRHFQRPSPPFALLPVPQADGIYDVGDSLELAATFWGRGLHSLADFARVLRAMGKCGFHHGQGCFELTAIEAEDASGRREVVWTERDLFGDLAPPIIDASWWLQRSDATNSVLLEFLTPARLISQGRPLFRVDFRRLFPFILRRVTSMVYAHCGREVIDDPSPLMASASLVREDANSLCWHDWRALEADRRVQDIGGISGSVRLSGEGLGDILRILRLGSLMNIGKGAAYGAGHFLLRDITNS